MIFNYIDVMGTFIFALSGASAGIRRGYDLFGILVLTFVTACGGGILRDLCIGATPPVGLINTEYLIAIFVAFFIGIFFQKLILKMQKPTLWLDAVGLGFFAAFGANKTYQYTQDIQLAVILGCVSAVGGGVLRDLLAGRLPVIFSKEIYAIAALIGAAIALLGPTGVMPQTLSMWLAIVVCVAVRVVSMYFNINLPSIGRNVKTPRQK